MWTLLGLALIWRTGMRDRGVITDHIEFGRRVLLGLDLYAPFEEGKPLHPPYPPSFGLLTAPFALLPERLARFAWGLLQVGCLFLIARRLRDYAREFVPAVLPRLHLLYAFVAILGARYILRDTHGGGGNLVNLALVLLAIDRARHHRQMRAGVILGFSLATKPVAILVIPLLWLFGYRRAASIAAASALGFLLLALLLLRQGPSPFLTWFDGSVEYAGMTDLFATPEGGFPPFQWMNQCLRCAVARFFGEVPPGLAAEVPGFVQGLGWSTAVTGWIARLANLSLLVVTFVWIWRRRGVPAARPWAIAAVLALALLLSPISWKAHHVALIPAFFMIGTVAFGGCIWSWILAGLYVLFCGLGEELVGKGWKEIQQAHYFTTFGTMAILGLCLWKVQTAAPVLSPGESRG